MGQTIRYDGVDCYENQFEFMVILFECGGICNVSYVKRRSKWHIPCAQNEVYLLCYYCGCLRAQLIRCPKQEQRND